MKVVFFTIYFNKHRVMSLLERKSATKAVSNFTIKPYLLPAYIILSALFILFVAYSYFKSAVYQVGIQQ